MHTKTYPAPGLFWGFDQTQTYLSHLGEDYDKFVVLIQVEFGNKHDNQGLF